MKYELEKTLYILLVAIVPMIPILCLWIWLNPIGFIQKIVMIIASIFCYIMFLIAWICTIAYVVDY